MLGSFSGGSEEAVAAAVALDVVEELLDFAAEDGFGNGELDVGLDVSGWVDPRGLEALGVFNEELAGFSVHPSSGGQYDGSGLEVGVGAGEVDGFHGGDLLVVLGLEEDRDSGEGIGADMDVGEGEVDNVADVRDGWVVGEKVGVSSLGVGVDVDFFGDGGAGNAEDGSEVVAGVVVDAGFGAVLGAGVEVGVEEVHLRCAPVAAGAFSSVRATFAMCC